MPTKTKNIFPKIKTKSGGYTCHIRFMDEARGERYFDTEWSVCGYSTPGRFSLSCAVSYDGRMLPTEEAINTIGKALRKGEVIVVQVTRWSMRGRSESKSVAVKVIEISRDTAVAIAYEAI